MHSSEFRVLPCFKNIPHFTVISSFHHHSWMTKLIGMKWKWLEWLLNDISPLWFSFLVILDILKWPRNGGMGRNGGVLEGKIKNWILRYLSFCYHLIIPISFRQELILPPIPKEFGMTVESFKIWNDIQMMECHWNYGIMSKWDWNELFWHQGYTITPDPPWCHAKIFFASLWVEG